MTNTTFRDQNDAIRTSGNFGPGTENPLIVTPGVADLGSEAISHLFLDIMLFDDFNEDIDPQGQHDMGELTYDGTTIWFKIDPAEEPDRRIFTIYLPEEH
jgi:hypothetical protein